MQGKGIKPEILKSHVGLSGEEELRWRVDAQLTRQNELS